APAHLTMNILSISCGINQNYTLDQVPGSGYLASNNCSSVESTCEGGTSPGIEKWLYETTVTLQGLCPDWTFSVTDCCRNSAITTLLNTSSDMYTETRFNSPVGDNSSPRFLNDPVFFININQDFQFNNGAFDPDGDSLSYSLIAPLTSGNTTVLYNAGYDALHPFSSTTISLDPATGDFFMHATQPEVGVIAFLVQEFRSGIMIGSIMREVTVFTVPWSGQPPALTGMDGTSQYEVAIFPNTITCFDIHSDDPDISDSLLMTWDHSIASATFTSTSGVIHPTGTFCWTPSLSDIRPQPYVFTATIRDNNCPLNQIGIASYRIYVTLDSTMVNTSNLIKEDLFSIVPNPSSGIFTIHSTQQFSQLKIYDTLGECILIKDFEKNVDLTAMQDGSYIVEAITLEGRTQRVKFLKE
ncbi:MAG: T9SS type A sorting domain-containing protein, partial [Bacteroidota bacterium]